ncbi:hypothetical protein FOC4_g10000533 [Fusarium odoratissimum]|uniref:Uncharacterized protein n=1 Tax=Fusarium oxysporum f. sp. cubense (strain race 4) TaxID=2502994 RepID=N1S7F4_FUSC4|nr:hypothetical protein FOC4_g10000533 [Fusarium odoratissimum]
MRLMQSTGSYLLLQKGTAAPSVKANTLTKCNKDMPLLLGDNNKRSTYNSLSFFIFHIFLLLPSFPFLTYTHSQMKSIAAPLV